MERELVINEIRNQLNSLKVKILNAEGELNYLYMRRKELDSRLTFCLLMDADDISLNKLDAVMSNFSTPPGAVDEDSTRCPFEALQEGMEQSTSN